MPSAISTSWTTADTLAYAYPDVVYVAADQPDDVLYTLQLAPRQTDR